MFKIISKMSIKLWVWKFKNGRGHLKELEKAAFKK
jgi:hypothetical protein